MLNYYPSNPNINHSKKQSFNPAIETKISNTHNSNQPKRNYSPIYSKKSTSLDKSLLRTKNIPTNLSLSSISKQIKEKKLASSQYNNASFKTEANTSKNQANYSTYIHYRKPSPSKNNEKKINITETKERNKSEYKGNFSPEKLKRKKILTVDTDLNSNYTSFFETNKEINRTSLLNKKDQPFKIYTESNFINEIETNNTISKGTENPVGLTTDSNSFESNKDRSSFSKSYINDKDNKNSFNKQTQRSLDRHLIEIELQMEKALLDNKTNSKSKKYNTIKHSFEEVIKLIPSISNSKLFHKLLVGYHEVVTSFSNENRELKEANNDLTNKLSNSSKTIYDYQNQILNHQHDISQLKKRVLELEKIQEQMIISKSSDASTQMQGSNGTDKEININSNSNNNNYNNNNNAEINIQHNHILDLNKNNLGDLDALYFFDKVESRPRSSSFSKLIPRLELNSNNNQEVKSKVTVTINNQNKINNSGLLNNNTYLKTKNIYKK